MTLAQTIQCIPRLAQIQDAQVQENCVKEIWYFVTVWSVVLTADAAAVYYFKK
jgi:hypothetical protein